MGLSDLLKQMQEQQVEGLKHMFLQQAQEVFWARHYEEFNEFLRTEGETVFRTLLAAANTQARTEVPAAFAGTAPESLREHFEHMVKSVIEHGILLEKDFDAAVVQWEKMKAGDVEVLSGPTRRPS